MLGASSGGGPGRHPVLTMEPDHTKSRMHCNGKRHEDIREMELSTMSCGMIGGGQE